MRRPAGEVEPLRRELLVALDAQHQLRLDVEQRETRRPSRSAAGDVRRSLTSSVQRFGSITMTSIVTNWPLNVCVQSWRLTSSQARAGIADALHHVAHEQLRGRHQKRGGHAVAGDVADDDDDAAVGQLEPVVEVAADVAGGLVDGGDVDSRAATFVFGQPVELDCAGVLDLFFHYLMLHSLQSHQTANELKRCRGDQPHDDDRDGASPRRARP